MAVANHNELDFCNNELDFCNNQLYVIKNGSIECPAITNNALYVPSQQINYVLFRTISFLNIQILDISDNKITWLPDLFSLRILKCENCKLTALPTYMPNLEELNCNNNYIKLMPDYPRLSKLNCSNNLIEQLPSMLKLRTLQISDNPIYDINIQSLTSLIAYNCPILVIRKNPLLIKRSSKIDGSVFKWVSTTNAKVDYDKIIIDWNISKLYMHNVNKPRILNKLYSFLFIE